MTDKQSSYFVRRLCRAWADTIGPLGWNIRTAFNGFQIIVVTLLFVLIFLGKDEAKVELKIALAFVGASIVVFCLNFIWNYIATPARMQLEADKTIDDLRRSIEEKYFTVKGIIESLKDGKVNMVSIEVTNPTNKTIRNVTAAIDSIEALSSNEWFERHGHKLLGHFFTLVGPIDPFGSSKYLVDLHPKQSETFNIVSVNIIPANNAFHFIRDSKRTDEQGRDHYPVTGERSTPAGHYKVSVVVRGEDAAPERAAFILESTETKTKAVQVDGEG